MTQIAPENSVSALLVGQYDTDRLLVRDVFRNSGWRLFEARDRRQAWRILTESLIQVVITESSLPKGNWKHLLSDLRRLPRAPQLVVTSRIADDRLWSEVLNLGGYDVLARPFEAEELLRVVEAAGRAFWRRPNEAVRTTASSFYSVA